MNAEACSGAALDTVIIYTTGLEGLSAFYAEGLGLGPFETLPGHKGCRAGAVYFGFDQMDDVKGGAGGATLWFTVDDIKASFDHLLSLGAVSNSPPTRKPWGGVLASVFDPDGNLLGLSQRS